MNVASCIKIYILVSFFKKIYEEKIDINMKIKYEQSNYVNGSGILQYLTPGLEMSLKDIATAKP